MLAEYLSQEFLNHVLEVLPVILSLIIIEGLLSVDNALGIAAMAAHLPGRQKYVALKVGIIGAYLFRGLALLLAHHIIANPWLKIAGAAYLIHLMAHHFVTKHKVARAEEAAKEAEESGISAATIAKVAHKGFWATVVSIELMDLSLGVDNVVAAVALSDELWVVITGVFIGILALRFIAGYCIRLIEKFPVLEHTAFLLIGFVGAILLVELFTHVDVKTWQKFIGIVAIIAFTIWYSKKPSLQKFMRPINAFLMWPLRIYDTILGSIILVLLSPFRCLLHKAQIPVPVDAVGTAPAILHEASMQEDSDRPSN